MATLEEILYTTKYGTYYNPATSHYNKPFVNVIVNVICDNCHKENLKSCIGHNNCDLCLECADKINNNSHFPTSPFPTSPFPTSPFPTSPFPTPSYYSTRLPSGSMCFSVPTAQ